MARQTAVQWLEKKMSLLPVSTPPLFQKLLKQAKEIELEQMEDAYDKGKTSDKFAPDDSFKAYYNKYYEREGDYDDYQERLKYLKDL